MRRRSAHIEVLDRRAEARPSRSRTQEEELLQRKLALENVAFTQPPLAFEIERSHHLLVQDNVFQIRRVLGNCVDHGIPEIIAKLVPIQPRLQLVWRVLNE